MYDYMIVGCGFVGAVAARELAELGKKVIIIDRREHIAGNMYDELDADGILIQKYGPHSIFTNNKKIIDYLQKFCVWNQCHVNAQTLIDGKLIDMPFNFKSIDQIYEKSEAEQLKKALKDTFISKDRVSIYELLQSHIPKVAEFANYLYEKEYKPYTAKQWGTPPEELDKSVLERVKVVLSYDDSYTGAQFEMIPVCGFTQLFRSILDHSNIHVILNKDALELIEFNKEYSRIDIKDNLFASNQIIYTGALDELFDFCFGRLPYRSLDIEFETYDTEQLLERVFVCYPGKEKYTRKAEYKKLTHQFLPQKTTVSVEYPTFYDPILKNEPYYPILTEENVQIAMRYKEKSKAIKNLIIAGRLADYKYYNMDQAIEKAWEIIELLQRKMIFDSSS